MHPLKSFSDAHLRSWSHQYAMPCSLVDLVSIEDWRALLARAQADKKAVALRAAGLSWTDITMTKGGLVASTTNLGEILGFDTDAGSLTAQGGVTLKAIMETIVPHGWFLSCLPGSLDVTLGGAIACNVHGKDGHSNGTFCEQVEALNLIDGMGRKRHIDRSSGTDILKAVFGSMGLLGLITDATIKLRRIPSSSLRHQSIGVEGARNLGDFATRGLDHDFVWGWLDPQAAMRGQVHALAHCCNWADSEVQGTSPVRRKPCTPFPWRTLAPCLNAPKAQRAVSLAHQARRRTHSSKTTHRPWREVLFPHDRFSGLNSLFHKRGFTEIQAVIPAETLESLFTEIEHLEHDDRLVAFLVSFKLHRKSEGMLAFSGAGIGLSFVTTVFDQDPDVLDHQLLTLRKLILASGGRINLHRDGNITWDMAEAMYPDLLRFQEIKQQLDPDTLLHSEFWDRLNRSRADV